MNWICDILARLCAAFGPVSLLLHAWSGMAMLIGSLLFALTLSNLFLGVGNVTLGGKPPETPADYAILLSASFMFVCLGFLFLKFVRPRIKEFKD
jgi:uncharacterized membrane protein YedE/YeeE